jgi:hypothetical protein
MTYDEKYNAMPLRGKISPTAAVLKAYGCLCWGFDFTRRDARKYHRHYDPHKDWWHDDTIGVAYKHLPKWWVNEPSKGYKRKTWKDYN